MRRARRAARTPVPARDARSGSGRAAATGPGRDWGQSVVEFALLLPLFMLMLVIAIDFGRVFFSYVAINNAAREAAAYAATNPTDQVGMLQRAQQETNTQGQVGEGSLSVAATCHDPTGGAIACADAAGGNGTGNTITVTVSEQFTFITPMIGNAFGGALQMTTSSTTSVLGLAASNGTAPGACSTLPTPSFVAKVSGLSVTLDASASTPTTGQCAISGYNWDMGDGANPNPPVVGMNTTYSYSLAGTYRITLTLTNPAGTSTTYQDVTIGAPGPTPSPSPTPTAGPTPSPAPTPPVCNTAPGFTYTFTGTGNGAKKYEMTFYGSYTGQPAPASWSWAFGDGQTGTGQTTARDYNAVGSYTVALTVTNGTCVKTTSQSVTVP